MKIQVKRKTFKMNKSDDSQPVDLSYLQEYTDGDDDVMDELIEAFQETALEGLEELKKGVYETEMTVWNAAAHKLKGAAGYVGAAQLAALCVEAEGGGMVESDKRADLFNKIETSYAIICQFFEERNK